MIYLWFAFNYLPTQQHLSIFDFKSYIAYFDPLNKVWLQEKQIILFYLYTTHALTQTLSFKCNKLS